jgi:hypothetical protein
MTPAVWPLISDAATRLAQTATSDDPFSLAAGGWRLAHQTSQAAPRTPLESPKRGGTMRVARPSEKM